ncbi:CarD family transcriptional regulator [Priestia koreensis]|uniref:Transcription factor YdeB n=1 Tax=Priestia koreensis TaxID=284581 RepID=A0A0M0KWZ1_9BACI|nr:CarD family transcriptional regulator [Priestia koreensis]KOO42903.1 transcription factor YdeB [Priestia koreensis]
MEVAYLFQIGDHIFYPMHGAGTIEAIEDREILGEIQQYYIIRMPVNDMQVMIPKKKIETAGIRSVVDIQRLDQVMAIFDDADCVTLPSWKQRYQTNLEKMKTGDMQSCAEVVRDLSHLHKSKALNSSEKHMLENARKVLISELGLVKGMSQHQATELLSTKIRL